MKKRWVGIITCAVFLTSAKAEVMSFTDNFDSYADGNLNAAASWGNGMWETDFDVVDNAGDKTVLLDRQNRYSAIAVDSSAFNLTSGQDFVLTSTFASSSDNYLHGVVFNYTKTTVFNMYVLSMNRPGGVLTVSLDKWVNSDNKGSGSINIMSSALGSPTLLDGSGTMAVSYDSSAQSIGVNIIMDTGVSFSTNVVDAAFSSGQVGLIGKLSGDYVVNEFAVSSIPEPATLGLVSGFGALLILLRRHLNK
jgi:hypothetical protein